MPASLGGVYRGIVISSQDPMASGRSQVSIPKLGIESIWAPVCRPGGAIGSPLSVGAQVIVAFEGGSSAHPVILGQISR